MIAYTKEHDARRCYNLLHQIVLHLPVYYVTQFHVTRVETYDLS